MSKEFDNTNRGALFGNKERRTENDPHARGTLNVGGVEYWISAWTKTSKAGDRYQSLSVTAKDSKPEAGPRRATDVQNEFNDDIPF